MSRLNFGDEVEVTFTGTVSYVNVLHALDDDEFTYDIDGESDSGSFNIQYVPRDLIVVTRKILDVKPGDVVLTDRGHVLVFIELPGTSRFRYYGKSINTSPHGFDSFQVDEVVPVKIIGNVKDGE